MEGLGLVGGWVEGGDDLGGFGVIPVWGRQIPARRWLNPRAFRELPARFRVAPATGRDAPAKHRLTPPAFGLIPALLRDLPA